MSQNLKKTAEKYGFFFKPLQDKTIALTDTLIPIKRTNSLPGLLHKCTETHYFFNFKKEIKIEGNKTRLVKVAVINVSEVSQPRACVPPNPEKQKMMKPAMRTKDV